MAIFARTDSQLVPAPAAVKMTPRSVGARSVSEASEEMRLLNPETPTQLRRNVPAIAIGPQATTPRRPSLGMPSPSSSSGNRNDDLRKLTVGREIALAGDITECDYLIVEGTMDATLRSGQRMEIAQTGLFRGVANVREADIAGRFEGELSVAGRLRIRSGAQISGRVQYGELEVEAGGQIQGEMAYVPATPPPANDSDRA